ncbi:MAG: MBL fold metallo-hydrolase [Acidobacteria bacterium]|nr:MBL fold metallo-hydrolase [Acidobacteriota bacterium]
MSITRREFLRTGIAAASIGSVSGSLEAAQRGAREGIRLIRNATSIIRFGGRTLLLDPWLADAGAMPPVNNSPNPRPNPLVPLPLPAREVIAGVDATLLTHTHFDHWDPAARELLAKEGLLFVQPADTDRVRQAGFTNVQMIEPSLEWQGISLIRTIARHGRGDVGQRMGTVSGYVLKHAGSPTLYIAGDTIWCPEVADAIAAHAPDIIVVNAGEAQFLEGGPIIMGVDDVVQVCKAAPRAKVVAVHMEAVNHCVLSREGLRAGLERAGLAGRVAIPKDGEEILFG